MAPQEKAYHLAEYKIITSEMVQTKIVVFEELRDNNPRSTLMQTMCRMCRAPEAGLDTHHHPALCHGTP